MISISLPKQKPRFSSEGYGGISLRLNSSGMRTVCAGQPSIIIKSTVLATRVEIHHCVRILLRDLENGVNFTYLT